MLADDIGDRKGVEGRKRDARLKDRERRDVLREVLQSPAGREWLWDLLEFCHIYGSSFATNALVMAQREGERNVGLKVLADAMAAAPDKYLEMVQEHERRKDDGSGGSEAGDGSTGADLTSD